MTAPASSTRRAWRLPLSGPALWTVLLAVVGGAAMTVSLLALAGYFRPHITPGDRSAPELPEVEGTFVAARKIRRPLWETAVGTVQPAHETTLASKLLARVVEMKVVAGQAVEQGEVLVLMDDAEWQARVAQLEAALTSADATYAKAQSDLKRAERLFQQQAISTAEFETTQATLRTAAAEQVRARRAIDEARVMLAEATVRAPFRGTVIEKQVEAGDTVVPGQPLLTLYDPTHMQLVATVRESLAVDLRVGQSLPARLETLGFACEATIAEIVPQAEAASRSFIVKVVGPCPPGAYSGMFGRLEIPRGEEEVLVVPRAAVRQVGQLSLVEARRDGHLERRAIRVGRTLDEELVEVLAGLEVGEQVRIDGASPTPSAGVPAPNETREPAP